MKARQARQGKVLGGTFLIAAASAAVTGLGATGASAATPVTPAAKALAFSQTFGRGVSNTAVGVDGAGNIYAAATGGKGLPTTAGAIRSSSVGGSTYVYSLDPTGTKLRYASYWSRGAGTSAIAVRPDGTVILVGRAGDPDALDTSPGAAQSNIPYDGTAGFVAELNPTLTQQIYATYLGGGYDPATGYGGNDEIAGVAVDPSGNAIVVGSTDSTAATGFPETVDAYQHRPLEPNDNEDAFATVINPTGGLLYSTFIGGVTVDDTNGDGSSFGRSVATDANGDIFVGGLTTSNTFPVTASLRGAQQALSQNGFVFALTRIATSAKTTYVPKYSVLPVRGIITGLATDSTGAAYATGFTFLSSQAGTETPLEAFDSQAVPTTPGAFEPTSNGTEDANPTFVEKLNPTGTGLAYATYLGGDNGTIASSIAVDPLGNAWVTGNTYGSNFPTTPNALQTTSKSVHGDGAFLAGLNASGSNLVYSTYLTDSGVGSYANTVAVDTRGGVFVSGGSSASDFPRTAGPFAKPAPNYGNAFILGIR